MRAVNGHQVHCQSLEEAATLLDRRWTHLLSDVDPDTRPVATGSRTLFSSFAMAAVHVAPVRGTLQVTLATVDTQFDVTDRALILLVVFFALVLAFGLVGVGLALALFVLSFSRLAPTEDEIKNVNSDLARTFKASGVTVNFSS